MKTKRIFASVLVVLMALTVLFTFTACAKEEDTTDHLVVYNWADYIYPNYEEDFVAYYKEKTGRDITLTYVTFDTNETMLTKIINNDANVDVMCPSEYTIQKLVEGGYLLKLNYFTDENFVNSGNVDMEIVNKIRESFADMPYDMTEYFVPYMWGTLGILYNTQYIDRETAENAGWGLLWNTDGENVLSDELTNRVYMKDSIRDAYCATILYLKQYGMLPSGYENMTNEQLINTIDDKLLVAVEKSLIEQKKILYGYEVDFGKNELIAGTARVDLAWSGDALYAIEEGLAAENPVELDYFVPKSGGNIWFDGWVMPKTCKNVEAAKIFIDFLNGRTISMQNMMEIGYTSALDKNLLYEDEDVFDVFVENYAEDPENVSEEEMEQLRSDYADYFLDVRRYAVVNDPTLAVMHDFGVNNVSVISMWERVRSTGVSAVSLLLIVLGIVAVIVLFVAVAMRIRQIKKRCVKISK